MPGNSAVESGGFRRAWDERSLSTSQSYHSVSKRTPPQLVEKSSVARSCTPTGTCSVIPEVRLNADVRYTARTVGPYGFWNRVSGSDSVGSGNVSVHPPACGHADFRGECVRRLPRLRLHPKSMGGSNAMYLEV